MGEVDVFINVFTFVDFDDEVAQAIFEFALETKVSFSIAYNNTTN